MTVETVAIFSDVGKIALIFGILASAIDVANFMVADGVLKKMIVLLIFFFLKFYLSCGIDEFDSSVGNRKGNFLNRSILAFSNLLYRLLC